MVCVSEPMVSPFLKRNSAVVALDTRRSIGT